MIKRFAFDEYEAELLISLIVDAMESERDRFNAAVINEDLVEQEWATGSYNDYRRMAETLGYIIDRNIED